MKANRIFSTDTIKASSHDTKGKIIATVYDSGFHNINQVISFLKNKDAGWLKPVHEVRITNCDRDTHAYYTVSGKLK